MTLLVSGASGFLGTAFLRAVNEPVVALVRGADWAARAQTMARRSGAGVRGLNGDVRRADWGLSGEQLRELRLEVRAVVHLAGDVSWSAPWSRLAEVNIDGAARAAEVAGALQVPLLHAGSLYAGHDYGDEVGEHLLEEREHLTKYERSKLRGEWAIARTCRQRGGPALIARIPALSGDLDPAPGMRSGSSRVPFSRILQNGDWRVLPYASGARLDICPRDVVAAALVSLLAELPQDGLSVRNLGQAAGAPLVESIAREAVAASLGDTRLFPRPVRTPARVLNAISRQADRLDESSRNSALIGLRYFASKTVYTSSGLGREVSLRSLVRTLGMPTQAHPPAVDSYYASWPA
jgi:nucleoside-diphosphate-sugar epimerase